MRPVVLAFSGPSSPIPTDIYVQGPFYNVSVSGTGALQATNDSPYSPPATGFVWNTISPGAITTAYQAFRMASGVGVVTVVQQGIR